MKTNTIFILVILTLACAPQISSDIYLPSLISIAEQLPGANLNSAQISLSIFLLGVSSTQLVFGPLSEAIGRKTPLIIGLMIMALGSLVCISAYNIHMLIMGRFIQGLGAGALSALWRAMLRDVMSGEQLAKYGSFIGVFIIFMTAVAPVMGGYLEQLGWRTSFIFMFLYTIVCLLLLQLGYNTSNFKKDLAKLKMPYLIEKYKEVLTNKFFMSITLSVFLSYGALFIWIISAPEILMQQLNLSPVTFGWTVTIISAIGYSAGAVFNAHLVEHFGIPKMLQIGWCIMIISGIIMLAGYAIYGTSLWCILSSILIFLFGSTLIWPNAFAAAFTPFGHIAGYAGSLYGFMQLLGGFVFGSFIGVMDGIDQKILAEILIAVSLLSLLLYRFIAVPSKYSSS